MKTKKWFIAVAIILMTVLAFVSCGGGGAEQKAANNLLKALQKDDLDSIQKILSESGFDIAATLSTRSASPGGDFTYELWGSGIIINKYTGKGGVVIVPQEIEGYPVLAIGNRAFAGSYETPDPNPRARWGATVWVDGIHTNVTTVILPNTITVIGANAFRARDGLHTINLPTSLIRVDENAFNDCIELFNLIIPENLTSVEFNGWGHFRGCGKLMIRTRSQLQEMGYDDRF